MAKKNTETIKEWLLKQRLQNYGYDWKFFGKMAGHKTRLKSKIKGMSDADIRRNLAKARILGSGGRLSRTKGRVEYTTGQSFNEELVNMMHLGAGRKTSFWDLQERWI